MSPHTAVLLVNLGTPLSPHPKDVRKYLIEFLTDSRVIDKPWLKRQLLVRGLIAPKRYKITAKTYESIWTPEGSPLLFHGENLKRQLQQKLGEDYHVALAMRYQKPSIPIILQEIEKISCKHLIVIPLFPQYSSATTGSVYQCIMKYVSKWNRMPKTVFFDDYPTEPLMIQAFAENAKKFNLDSYDHFLFSFHGLPMSQIQKGDSQSKCLKTSDCCKKSNKFCYSSQCYSTAFSIAKSLNLSPQTTSICFQSRLGKEPWLQPYANEHLHHLLRHGIKKVLVFSPSFVADCLETLYEIGVEYKKEFLLAGGEAFDLVESLNANPYWVLALEKMIKEAN